MGRADRAQKRYDAIVKGQAAYSARNAGKLSGADAARDPDAMRHSNGKITVRFEASRGAVRRGERAARAIERQVDADGKRDAKNARKKGREEKKGREKK